MLDEDKITEEPELLDLSVDEAVVKKYVEEQGKKDLESEFVELSQAMDGA